ncbi:MAG TPA: hypothetical protein DHW82_07435 [Spirochaetia bacterium]|nr:MAG: hypothetical protein A2Y41_12250 [Spirochaetes bacterium GWB1_36_13]HCL56825.1 hypothetical protein [Spirochaetia bacterium]
MEIKKAVIVAAGLSSRLYPLTLERPKGLLPVGGKSLLERSIGILRKNGIEDIAVVVGYKKEMIMEALDSSITYIPNPFYKHCNNLGSLWFARNFVHNDPIVYMHGDIIYDEKIFSQTFQSFLKRKDDIELVTDFTRHDEESMKVRITKENYLIESSKEIPLDKAAGEWTGITYIRNSEAVFKYFSKVLFEEGLNHYDTKAFSEMAADGYKIYCSSTMELPWTEIDFIDDYEKAKSLFL